MADHRIEASFDVLMEQAGGTATSYMHVAASAIDARFGEGYARKNPLLVAAFMQSATLDFVNASRSAVMQELVSTLGYSLDAIAQSLNRDD
jgi:hypothetical protein